MGFFVSKHDTQLAIFQSRGSSLTGFQSQYVNTAVPATGNTIHGFQFDEAFWRSDVEENNAFVVPTLWDPVIGAITDRFQVGIGDNEDLLVEQVVAIDKNGIEVWVPEVVHGFYYAGHEEFYLYSDDSLTEYPTISGLWVSNLDITISGGNYVDLQFDPKPGIPILARTFRWNDDDGYYQIDEEAIKKIEFTPKVGSSSSITRTGDEFLWDNINTSEKEFVLDYSFSPPRVVFNQQVVEQVGRFLPTTSGYNSDEIESMELIGSTVERDFQEHHTKYAPIDQTSRVQVILENGLDTQEYILVSQFTASGSNEVIVDYDLGLLQFGSTDLGGRPPPAYNIRVAYFKTMALEYEPINTRDTCKEGLANLNPLTRYNADGFVFIRQKSEDVGSLVLTSELPEIAENFFGPLFIGNAFTKIIAKVLTIDGDPIEGQTVFFEILSGPDDATFGTDQTGSAVSAGNGNATILLNPPRTIQQLGGVTDEVTYSGGNSQLFLADYTPPTSSEDLFLFKVHSTDSILGIPKDDLLEFYEDFIEEQGTVSGQNKGPLITWSIGNLGDYGWISGAYADFIKWEILHRAFYDLPTPTTYEEDELRIGKKTVIAVFDPGAINPHTGSTVSGAFVPLQPDSYTITTSGTLVDFDYTLPPATGDTKSYLVIGPTNVTIRAYTINERNNEFIYSNEISILVDIPNTSNGLLNIDAINSVPSGVLGNALNWDQENLELESVNITSSGLLPLGWRIRSPGITIASALDSITFLDINPLNSPDDTISHEFTVVI